MHLEYNNQTQETEIVLREAPVTQLERLASTVWVYLLSEGPGLPEDGERPGAFRGWWGDSFVAGAAVGRSRLWAFENNIMSLATLSAIEESVSASLAPMRDAGLVDGIEVTVEAETDTTASISLQMRLPSGSGDELSGGLWDLSLGVIPYG